MVLSMICLLGKKALCSGRGEYVEMGFKAISLVCYDLLCDIPQANGSVSLQFGWVLNFGDQGKVGLVYVFKVSTGVEEL